ncbi:MAG: hypothetical protein LBE27_04520 [Deltaproteobacteria bacterium]|nr:hypothetical protein [Deltaproteobacteria bacterium]
MAETLSDIVFNYEAEGEVLSEELDRVILQKGVWAVILFRYRERNRKTGEFGPPKACLRRYQKYKGDYKKRDSINLSQESAQALVDQLSAWMDEGLLGEDNSESGMD